jgi:hypothetical protein
MYLNTKNGIISFFTVLMLILISIPISVRANAVIAWEDTFDTENSLQDWEISHGNYSVDEAEGVLVGSVDCYYDSGFDWCANYLWRDSTASTGTWSFDILLPENFAFFFFYYVGISAIADGRHPDAGYTFIMNPSEIKINYRYSSSNRGNLDTYVLTDSVDGWQHFDITRNETGHIWVLLNGTKILNALDQFHTSSESINIQAEPRTRLDNITYSPLDPNPTSTQEISPSWTLMVVIMSITALQITQKKKRDN